MKINEKIEKRNKLIKRCKDLVTLSEKEERKMTEGELGEYQKWIDEVDSLKKEIDRDNQLEKLEKENLTAVNTNTDIEGDEKERYSKSFEKWIRQTKDMSNLTGEDKKVLNRAQTITTTGGGYLIAEDFGAKIIEYLVAYGGMREVATILNTENGADLPFPTNDDTSNKGAILAINTQISEQDLTFGQVVLGEYMYTSKLVRVPWQLLQDSYFDFPSYLAQQLATRLGRIHNDHFTTGTGSSQPKGVVTAATASGVTATVSALTRANMVALIHSVDPEYRKNGRLMFNDATLKALRLLVDGNSRPIYQPNFATGAFDTIEGEPYTINQSMADIGASAKSVIYGDMKQYYIRDIMPMSMSVLLERYADYLQNGYFAYMRSDGDLMNTSAVKSLVHAAS